MVKYENEDELNYNLIEPVIQSKLGTDKRKSAIDIYYPIYTYKSATE